MLFRSINNNAIMPNTKLSESVRFSYGNGTYSIIDNKNINNSYVNSVITTSVLTVSSCKYVRVVINLANTVEKLDSWALVDEHNNILIASNENMENVSQIIFYVIPRRNRI